MAKPNRRTRAGDKQARQAQAKENRRKWKPSGLPPAVMAEVKKNLPKGAGKITVMRRGNKIRVMFERAGQRFTVHPWEVTQAGYKVFPNSNVRAQQAGVNISPTFLNKPVFKPTINVPPAQVTVNPQIVMPEVGGRREERMERERPVRAPRPNREPMLLEVHTWLEPFKNLQKMEMIGFEGYKFEKVPKKPGRFSSAVAKRQWNAYRSHIAGRGAVENLIRAWHNTILYEQRRLEAIIGTHGRAPTARELANSKNTITAAQTAALKAVNELKKGFGQIRGRMRNLKVR